MSLQSAMHHICTNAIHHLFYKKLSLEILHMNLFSVFFFFFGGVGWDFVEKNCVLLSRYRRFSGHSAVRHLLVTTVRAAEIKLV